MRRMRNAPCALDQLDKNLTNGLTYLVLFSLSLPNYSDNSLGWIGKQLELWQWGHCGDRQDQSAADLAEPEATAVH